MKKKKKKKKNQKEFRIEKLIKRKGSKLYAKWKGYDNLFNSWWIKKPWYKWVNIFQKPKSLGANVKAELDLSDFATKAG